MDKYKCEALQAAYPFVTEYYEPEPGLTKREYFAAAILPAIIRDYSGHTNMQTGDIVAAAVHYADSLIDALNNIEVNL